MESGTGTAIEANAAGALNGQGASRLQPSRFRITDDDLESVATKLESVRLHSVHVEGGRLGVEAIDAVTAIRWGN